MRKLSIVLMVLLLLVMGSVVSAQDLPCGDLSEDDCALFHGAFASIGTVDSASFTLDVSVTTTADDEETTTTITGDGSFSGVQGLSSTLMSAAMTDSTDMTAMMGTLTEALGEFNGALNLTVDAGTGSPLDIQLVLVDSVGYVNFGALGLAGMQLGEDMTLPEWGGINLPELIATMGPQMSGMMDGMTGTVPGADDVDASEVTPSTVLNYVVVTRADDDVMDDGVGVAVFDVTVDFEGLANDPEVQAAADADSEELMAQYGATEFAATVYVGLEDGFLYGFDIDTAVDASSMADAEAGTISISPTSASVSLYFADFNTAPVVDAPEGAEIATTQQLMGLMGMMMGGPASR